MTQVLGLFTTKQTAHLTGLSERQLAYWDRTDIYQPSRRSEDVPRPYTRVYDFRDLVALRTLALLRKHVPLQELRRVGEWLHEHFEQPWSRLRFFVAGRTVYFVDPRTGVMVSATEPGQGAIEFELEPIAQDLSNRIDASHVRSEKQAGEIGQHRYVLHNEPVLSGTRIPTYIIWDLYQSGHTVASIRKQYPELTENDIRSAIIYERERNEPVTASGS